MLKKIERKRFVVYCADLLGIFTLKYSYNNIIILMPVIFY